MIHVVTDQNWRQVYELNLTEIQIEIFIDVCTCGFLYTYICFFARSADRT